jgi:hypothetical protein
MTNHETDFDTTHDTTHDAAVDTGPDMHDAAADTGPDTTADRAPEVTAARTSDVTTDRAPGPSADIAPDVTVAHTNSTTMDSETNLLPANDIERYRDEWRAVQAGFVDDPQAAVRDADKLLGLVVDRFTSRLAERRTELSNGDGHETEHLRLALRSYRSMFDQLIGA